MPRCHTHTHLRKLEDSPAPGPKRGKEVHIPPTKDRYVYVYVAHNGTGSLKRSLLSLCLRFDACRRVNAPFYYISTPKGYTVCVCLSRARSLMTVGSVFFRPRVVVSSCFGCERWKGPRRVAVCRVREGIGLGNFDSCSFGESGLLQWCGGGAFIGNSFVGMDLSRPCLIRIGRLWKSPAEDYWMRIEDVTAVVVAVSM